MADRRRLPPTRDAVTRKFEIRSTEKRTHECPSCGHVHEELVGTVEGYVTAGFYEDGTLGEAFVKLDKQGSTVSGLIDAWAIALSWLLQLGVGVDQLVAKFRGSRFEPAGFTGEGWRGIPKASSPIDYVMQYLEDLVARRSGKPKAEETEDHGEEEADGDPR